MGYALSEISIEIFSQEMFARFWDMVQYSCPNIHEISIEAPRIVFSVSVLTNQLQAFYSLKHLVSLRSLEKGRGTGRIGLSPQHLAYLASVPTLRLLEFRIQNHFSPAISRTNAITQNDQFTSLRRLDVHIDSIKLLKTFCSFIEPCLLPALNFVLMWLKEHPTASNLKRLFGAISSKPSMRSLLISLDSTPTLGPSYTITDDIIYPLFRVSLQRLGLANLPYDFTEHTFTLMGASWPRLSALTLCQVSPNEGTIFPSMLRVTDLGLLAQKVPSLTGLMLHLNMEDIGAMQMESFKHPARQRATSPVELDLMGSRLPDSYGQTLLAAYLTSIFPKIRVIGEDAGIKDLQKLVELFKAVRSSEREQGSTVA